MTVRPSTPATYLVDDIGFIVLYPEDIEDLLALLRTEVRDDANPQHQRLLVPPELELEQGEYQVDGVCDLRLLPRRARREPLRIRRRYVSIGGDPAAGLVVTLGRHRVRIRSSGVPGPAQRALIDQVVVRLRAASSTGLRLRLQVLPAALLVVGLIAGTTVAGALRQRGDDYGAILALLFTSFVLGIASSSLWRRSACVIRHDRRDAAVDRQAQRRQALVVGALGAVAGSAVTAALALVIRAVAG